MSYCVCKKVNVHMFMGQNWDLRSGSGVFALEQVLLEVSLSLRVI